MSFLCSLLLGRIAPVIPYLRASRRTVAMLGSVIYDKRDKVFAGACGGDRGDSGETAGDKESHRVAPVASERPVGHTWVYRAIAGAVRDVHFLISLRFKLR